MGPNKFPCARVRYLPRRNDGPCSSRRRCVQRRPPDDSFKPHILEARPTLHFPHSEGHFRLRRFWLLENSTDFSAANAFAPVFSQFQWPSHYPSVTALIRLRDTCVECFRAHDPTKSTCIEALRTTTAYYALYHAQLIWSTWKSLEVEVEKLPPDLPLDLLIYQREDERDGGDILEHLHVDAGDRSEPAKSARFLSYIAPYWFCGGPDGAIRFRPNPLTDPERTRRGARRIPDIELRDHHRLRALRRSCGRLPFASGGFGSSQPRVRIAPSMNSQ